MKLSIQDLFIKCEETCQKPPICPHLVKQALMVNFISDVVLYILWDSHTFFGITNYHIPIMWHASICSQYTIKIVLQNHFYLNIFAKNVAI